MPTEPLAHCLVYKKCSNKFQLLLLFSSISLDQWKWLYQINPPSLCSQSGMPMPWAQTGSFLESIRKSQEPQSACYDGLKLEQIKNTYGWPPPKLCTSILPSQSTLIYPVLLFSTASQSFIRLLII